MSLSGVITKPVSEASFIYDVAQLSLIWKHGDTENPLRLKLSTETWLWQAFEHIQEWFISNLVYQRLETGMSCYSTVS